MQRRRGAERRPFIWPAVCRSFEKNQTPTASRRKAMTRLTMTRLTSSTRFNRRTVLKGAGLVAAAQVATPFIIAARGETAIRIGMVDPLTGVYAAPAGNEVMG